ncbi:hypothetical protein KSC_043400 [Ktedonobacter sp. SOSP1-52]|uniref:antibiotic biosynthesis monooxygenase family protein n=1 Tax=Ktedonobacter sp. SOSP1-52 TaxID=2778366 RepID=UPI001915B74D|nr:antibiotic biosynthesis monooxygenase family protein [Ktedonobacter sp. SOSP1-52]GHO65448.1 hypothetical protein KSC_043400 [Ktedonobacter sp. SOSP1-52]
MIRAILTMKVKEGQEGDFEQAWQSVAEYTRGVPGNLRQTLGQSVHDPSLFIITSDWESQDAFHHFERSPEQDRVTAPLRALRESARMDIQYIVAQIERNIAS